MPGPTPSPAPPEPKAQAAPSSPGAKAVPRVNYHLSPHEPPLTRDHAAGAIDEFTLPGCLTKILDFKETGLLATKTYVENYLLTAGNPADPVERILLEELILAHQRVMQLHTSASQAKHAEIIKALNGAATRLQGEVRRCALALRVYRLPPGQKTFSVIAQQNIATAGGRQDVAYVDSGQGKETLSARDRLNGNDDDQCLHRNRAGSQEPTTSCGRPDQRLETSAVDA